MIIVCDTNILISAFIFPGGPPDKIVRLVLTGRFRHTTSPDLLTEFRRVLKSKFQLSARRIEEFVSLIADNSFLTYPTERESVIKSDETDNRVLECAAAAKAKYLITGDRKDLLPLKRFKGTRILAPQEFCLEQGIL